MLSFPWELNSMSLLMIDKAFQELEPSAHLCCLLFPVSTLSVSLCCSTVRAVLFYFYLKCNKMEKGVTLYGSHICSKIFARKQNRIHSTFIHAIFRSRKSTSSRRRKVMVSFCSVLECRKICQIQLRVFKSVFNIKGKPRKVT